MFFYHVYNDIDFSYLQIKEINIPVGFEPTLSRFEDHGVIYNICVIGCAKQITETPQTFDQSYCFVSFTCTYCFTRRPVLITKQPTSQMLRLIYKTFQSTYHINYLGQCDAICNVDWFTVVDRRSYSLVIVDQQIPYQSVFVFVREY